MQILSFFYFHSNRYFIFIKVIAPVEKPVNNTTCFKINIQCQKSQKYFRAYLSNGKFYRKNIIYRGCNTNEMSKDQFVHTCAKIICDLSA